jgi:hypothetical protein
MLGHGQYPVHADGIHEASGQDGTGAECIPDGCISKSVALQPETGTPYFGFDSGNALAIFDWIPTEITIDTPLDRGPDCAYC